MPSGGILGFDGNTVRLVRLERHWTQEQLAIRAGCAPSTISKLEADRARPVPALLTRIAAVLRVDPNELAPLPPEPTLRHIRERQGHTIAAIAVAAGLAASSLGRIERGISRPHRPADIARAYRLSLTEFQRAWDSARRWSLKTPSARKPPVFQ